MSNENQNLDNQNYGDNTLIENLSKQMVASFIENLASDICAYSKLKSYSEFMDDFVQENGGKQEYILNEEQLSNDLHAYAVNKVSEYDSDIARINSYFDGKNGISDKQLSNLIEKIASNIYDQQIDVKQFIGKLKGLEFHDVLIGQLEGKDIKIEREILPDPEPTITRKISNKEPDMF